MIRTSFGIASTFHRRAGEEAADYRRYGGTIVSDHKGSDGWGSVRNTVSGCDILQTRSGA